MTATATATSAAVLLLLLASSIGGALSQELEPPAAPEMAMPPKMAWEGASGAVPCHDWIPAPGDPPSVYQRCAAYGGHFGGPGAVRRPARCSPPYFDAGAYAARAADPGEEGPPDPWWDVCAEW